MKRSVVSSLGVGLVLTVAGCQVDSAMSPASPDRRLPTHLRPSSSIVPIDVFGITAHAPPGRACSAPEYRQFDFWVGTWDVFFKQTAFLVGTNVVEVELGGCAVEENWIASQGGSQGRSLNFYDASIGRWTQMWVATGGGPFTPLLLEGGVLNGSMVMDYDRTSPTGFFFPFPPPGRTVHRLYDRITWTPLTGGSVRQFGESAQDGGPVLEAYDFRYDAVESVTPLPTTTAGQCVARAQNRQFDYMLGEWDVYEGGGQTNGKAQGTAVYTVDMNGCLIEERLTGPGGYEGWSFNSWSVFTTEWHRTYVDNEGQRLVMTGAIVGGDMVMTGVRTAADGRTVHIRVTWDRLDAATVVQRWAFSRNGGATWPVNQDVTLRRRTA